MTITTQFNIGDFVEHILDEPCNPGLVIAFMVRGLNHSYQVQWDSFKEAPWHLEFELRPASKREPIAIPIKDV